MRWGEKAFLKPSRRLTAGNSFCSWKEPSTFSSFFIAHAREEIKAQRDIAAQVCSDCLPSLVRGRKRKHTWAGSLLCCTGKTIFYSKDWETEAHFPSTLSPATFESSLLCEEGTSPTVLGRNELRATRRPAETMDEPWLPSRSFFLHSFYLPHNTAWSRKTQPCVDSHREKVTFFSQEDYWI